MEGARIRLKYTVWQEHVIFLSQWFWEREGNAKKFWNQNCNWLKENLTFVIILKHIGMYFNMTFALLGFPEK